MTKNREFLLYRKICARLGVCAPMTRREFARQETILMFPEDEFIIKTIRALVALGELA